MAETFEPTVANESKHRKYLKRIKAKSNEPEFLIASDDTKDQIKFKMCAIFNWYSNRFDPAHAKKWIVEYAANKHRKDVDAVMASNDFTNTAGWIARLIGRGVENIPKKYEKYLLETLKRMKLDGEANLIKQQDKIKKLHSGRNRIQQNILNKAKKKLDDCIMNIEGQIDGLLVAKNFKNDCDFSALISEHDLVKEQLKEIGVHFEDHHLKELREVRKKKDESLVEGYSCFSTSQLKKLIAYIESVVDACELLEAKTPEKTVQKRKPRKLKPKPPSKQVKKLFFQAKDNHYGLNSVAPEKIVGASQLWVFNTKTRYLGCYEACDSIGFTVKGSSIKNFDKKKSIEKKLRKPNEVLKNVLEGGKIVLRKLLPEIHTKQKTLTGRINKFTILLRVL